MQILLLKDVDKVGREGEMVTVADGYARNYLIPKKIAIKATKGAGDIQKSLHRKRIARAQAELEECQELGERIENLSCTRKGSSDRLRRRILPQPSSKKGWSWTRRKSCLKPPSKTSAFTR
jgi:large subunit ribosomal protein L9